MFRILTRSKIEPMVALTISGDLIDKSQFWATDNPHRFSGVVIVPQQEVFFEAYTPNSAGSHTAWKPFEHYKRSLGGDAGCSQTIVAHEYDGWRVSSLVPNRFAGWVDGWYSDYSPHKDYKDLCTIGSPQVLVELVPKPSEADELEAMSCKAMLPGITDRMSLLNSIYELKDMASVPQSIRKYVDLFHIPWGGLTLRELVIRLLTPGMGKKAVAHVINSDVDKMADLWLQLNFNLMPLISDIAGFFTAMMRVSAEINRLIALANTPITRHFVWRWKEVPIKRSFTHSRELGGPQWPIPVFCTSKSTSSDTEYEYHATLQYNYMLSDDQLAHAQLFGTMDALGVNLNPAIIWNAIPWSFVVDWFVGVSRWLDQFKRRMLEPQVNILRYCASIKAVRHIDCVKTVYGGFSWPATINVPMPRMTEEAYRRWVQYPSIYSITSSGLSLKEFSLGAALVKTRNWSKKRLRSGR